MLKLTNFAKCVEEVTPNQFQCGLVSPSCAEKCTKIRVLKPKEEFVFTGDLLRETYKDGDFPHCTYRFTHPTYLCLGIGFNENFIWYLQNLCDI